MVFIILQIFGRGQFGRAAFFLFIYWRAGAGGPPSCPYIYFVHIQKKGKTTATEPFDSIQNIHSATICHISNTYKVKYLSNSSGSKLALPPREIAPFIARSLMDGEHRAAN